MTDIKKALASCGAESWRIFREETDSYQLFFVHEKLETVRRAVNCETTVTVYLPHDGKTGASSFSVNAGTTPDALCALIRRALHRAALICDEPYELPGAESGAFEVPSNLAGRDPVEIGAHLAELIFSVPAPENCTINALEIFVTERRQTVCNSRGLEKTQTLHGLQYEIVPTCNGKDGSVELFEDYFLNDLDDDAVAAEIAAKMEAVAARSRAARPEAPIACPVLLRPTELRVLFGKLAGDANYEMVYAHANLHAVGDAWQTAPTGDPVRLTMKDAAPGCSTGLRFDRDGVTLVPCTVIDGGKVVANYGAMRPAQYLGKPVTGELPCIEVAPGAQSADELRRGPHLECVFLSALQVNLYNDYIGGEVRLAYWCDGQTRTPVTGISISGKLSEALNSLRLSSETGALRSYSGPVLGRIDGMKIY